MSFGKAEQHALLQQIDLGRPVPENLFSWAVEQGYVKVSDDGEYALTPKGWSFYNGD